MNTVALTEEQQNALDEISRNIQSKTYQSLGGYAGTGKSTCLSHLSNKYPNFKVCAFTGKAANVLRRKGICDAATIHSTIYHFEENYNGDLVFRLKNKSQIDFNGLFVDEASMINEEIFDDILSFKVPVVFFGDHGQLEPVGTKFNLMKEPDITLETIHRNANTIAKFADYLRKGNNSKDFKSEDDTVQIVPKKLVKTEDLSKTDQTICAFNKTRLLINRKVREFLKYEKKVVKNEKIICLKNNKTLGIFNGMQGNVVNISGKRITFRDDNNTLITVNAYLKQFGEEKLAEAAMSEKDLGFFDYGYCITCHKAQGDEWNNIIVIEEKCDLWDHKRWAYTAASRAKQKITWAI